MKRLVFLVLLVTVSFCSCSDSRPGLEANIPNVSREQSVMRDKHEKGKQLFKANCASCHYADDRKMVGPGLQGTRQRVPGGDWLYEYVRNASAMVESGDAYAVRLYEEYYKMEMTSFPQLTNEDIDAIFDYVDYVNK